MKITLSVDSAESVVIGHASLASIVFSLEDELCNLGFFSALVSHPASEVRSAVAGKSCLPIEMLWKLARDSSIDVVKAVASNETALNMFKQPQFQAMIDRDVSVASELANSLWMVSEDNLNGLIHSLLKHPDPLVVDTAADFDTNR